MKKVYSKKSTISGQEIFANGNIKKGEIVGIVSGPIVPNINNPYQE